MEKQRIKNNQDTHNGLQSGKSGSANYQGSL